MLSVAQLRVLGEVAAAVDAGRTVEHPQGRGSKSMPYRFLERMGYLFKASCEGEIPRYSITQQGRAVLEHCRAAAPRGPNNG